MKRQRPFNRLSTHWSSSKIGAAAGNILDLTVKGLETGKDPIIAAAPVPGLSVAFDVLIGVLKKVQVCRLRSCIVGMDGAVQ